MMKDYITDVELKESVETLNFMLIDELTKRFEEVCIEVSDKFSRNDDIKKLYKVIPKNMKITINNFHIICEVINKESIKVSIHKQFDKIIIQGMRYLLGEISTPLQKESLRKMSSR